MLSLDLAKQLRTRGIEAQIIARFLHSDPPFSQFFRLQEPENALTESDILIRNLTLPKWKAVILPPLYRCIWRQSTFPAAQRIYQAAYGKTLNRMVDSEIDLVHYFGTGLELLGCAGLQLARYRNIPFVAEPAAHFGQWGDHPNDLRFYGECDALFSHTHFEKACYLEKISHPPSIFVTGNGIHFSPLQNPKAFAREFDIPGPYLLFLGRQTPAKGFPLVQEAFLRLAEAHPNLHLILAGPSSNQPESRHPRIRNLGFLEESQKMRALAGATVMCLPSEGESFGLVYFEAWSQKCPVIGLDLPQLRETVGQSAGGFLCPDNVDDIVQRIKLLLESPELRQSMGAKGYEFAAGYAWPEILERYLSAYRELGGRPQFHCRS